MSMYSVACGFISRPPDRNTPLLSTAQPPLPACEARSIAIWIAGPSFVTPSALAPNSRASNRSAAWGHRASRLTSSVEAAKRANAGDRSSPSLVHIREQALMRLTADDRCTLELALHCLRGAMMVIGAGWGASARLAYVWAGAAPPGPRPAARYLLRTVAPTRARRSGWPAGWGVDGWPAAWVRGNPGRRGARRARAAYV